MPSHRSTSLRLWGALGFLLLLPACSAEEAQTFITTLLTFIAVVFVVALAFAAIHWVTLGLGVGLAILTPFDPTRRSAKAGLVVAGLNLAWGVIELAQPHTLQPFSQNEPETRAIILSLTVGVMGMVMSTIALLWPAKAK